MMVPAALSAREERGGDWICLECEETGEPDEVRFRTLAHETAVEPGAAPFPTRRAPA
jgi:hypothetical protein